MLCMHASSLGKVALPTDFRAVGFVEDIGPIGRLVGPIGRPFGPIGRPVGPTDRLVSAIGRPGVPIGPIVKYCIENSPLANGGAVPPHIILNTRISTHSTEIFL
jgi:hypothetical protein